jgi:acyl carrier protein
MTNLEKYKNAFIENFEVSEDQLDDLVYQSVETWDSVGHMGLIADLEDSFDITLEMDDIVDFSGFLEGKNILAKYDVSF